MFNFNRTLQNLGLARAPKTHYGRYGGGAALPILAALAYRYREPILRFVRGKMDALRARRQEYANRTSQPV